MVFLTYNFLACVILFASQLSTAVASTDLLQFTLISTHPSDRELSGEGADSEEAQGIAFNGLRWFYANRWNVYRLSGDFGQSDLRFKVSEHHFGSTRCDHVGGIDSYGNELYAALDNCSDGHARVAVFDSNLSLLRSAVVPELKHSFPWVAVNPLDEEFFYTVAHNGRRLLAFRRSFTNSSSLTSVKAVHFQDHPQDVLAHFWKQGGAFSANGLFFRAVDDAKDEDSDFTGIWVYELDQPIQDGSAARRVSFINIRYDPDIWVPFACGFDECKRNYELEDLDAYSVAGTETSGDVHIIMLSNELDEDDVTIYHYTSGDHDRDGVRDTQDNCLWTANSEQIDMDRDRVGQVCDSDDIAALLPTIFLLLH